MGSDTACGLAAGCVARQATTRPGRRATRCYTPATLPMLACDMTHCTPRHGAVRARLGSSARSLGAPCAQPGSVGCVPMHLTQFWTQCTVIVTVWTTVHEHCSQDFSKRKK